jgi:hypothetical protein
MYFSEFYPDLCRQAAQRRLVCACPHPFTHAALTVSMEARHAR